MQHRKTKLLLIIGFILILFGCQKFLDIKIEDKKTKLPVFRFYWPSGGDKALSVHVETFVVFQDTPEGGRDTIWKIESRSVRISSEAKSEPSSLEKIKYGVTPEGFVTVRSPKPLRDGKKYRVQSSLSIEDDPSVVGAGGKFVHQN